MSPASYYLQSSDAQFETPYPRSAGFDTDTDQSSTESMTPPSFAHVQLNDVPRTLDPANYGGRVLSARWRGDGDGELVRAGFRLGTAKI